VVVVQGYLAHKKPHPPRTLQLNYVYGPTAVLGGGGVLLSKVPLYRNFKRGIKKKKNTREKKKKVGDSRHVAPCRRGPAYIQGYLAHKKSPHPSTLQ